MAAWFREDGVYRRLAALEPGERVSLIRAVELKSREIGFQYRARAGAPASPHPLALNPIVLGRSQARELGDLARAVLRLHLALPAMYREGRPEVVIACALERRSREWLALLPRAGSSTRTLIRIDVSWTAQGEPALFETNATAVAGFLYHPAAVRLLDEVVAPALGWSGGMPWGATPDMTAFLFRWLARSAGARGRVGFVEEPPFGPGDTEMPALAGIFTRRGMRCGWGAPWDVLERRGGFTLRGAPVDWLFRDLNLHELPKPGEPRLAGFEAMARAGRVLPGLGAEFDHKGMLELLTSRAFEELFSRAQVALLRRCVPWTRVVYERKTDGPGGKTVDLLPFVARCPECWVLKPNRGCGGEGVIFGRESPGPWRKTFAQAARRPGAWVVQERKDVGRKPLLILRHGRLKAVDAYWSIGVFCGGADYGFYARANPRPIVNVARGGAVAAVYYA